MYDSTNSYVTKDLYMEFAGIDLDIELKSSQSDNPTLHVSLFLKQQQQWLYNYMRYKFDTTKWDTEWDDDTFQDALLWQIKYVLVNGENGKLDKTAYVILREKAMANPKVFGA